MALPARQLAALAGNALTQVLRTPAFGLVLVVALVVAGVIPGLDYLSFLEKRRLVADSLLALSTAAGLFAGAVGAALVVGDDLRRRTALIVLSQPVGRGVFLAGKLLGLAGALALLWCCLGLATLWGSRVAIHDYQPDRFATGAYFAVLALSLVVAAAVSRWRGQSFAAAATGSLLVGLVVGFGLLQLVGYRGHGAGGAALVDWRQVPAVLCLYPGLVLGAAVALTAACWLPPAPTLVITASVVLVGLLADWFLGSAGPVGRALLVLVPNWQPFQVADRLAGGDLTWAYVGRAWLFGGLQAAAVLAVGHAWFEQRELG